jgi:hypothetical protein
MLANILKIKVILALLLRRKYRRHFEGSLWHIYLPTPMHLVVCGAFPLLPGLPILPVQPLLLCLLICSPVFARIHIFAAFFLFEQKMTSLV